MPRIAWTSALGVEGFGVSTRSRSVKAFPSGPTMSVLTPVPPMSMQSVRGPSDAADGPPREAGRPLRFVMTRSPAVRVLAGPSALLLELAVELATHRDPPGTVGRAYRA